MGTKHKTEARPDVFQSRSAGADAELIRVRNSNVAEVRRLVQERLVRTATYPTFNSVIQAAADEGYALSEYYCREIKEELKQTHPDLWNLPRSKTRSRSAASESKLVRVCYSNVAEVRRLIRARLSLTATVPTFRTICAAAEAEGYSLSNWYYRQIYAELKSSNPELWNFLPATTRSDRNLLSLKSKVTRAERKLHDILGKALGVDDEELMSIMLRVVAHATTRGILPLTNIVAMSRTTSDDELAVFGEILKAVNLADV